MTIDSLLTNAQTLESELENGSLIRGVLVGHKDHIMEEQRIQLLGGKSSSGEDLHPYYTEDRYFHSTASAKRYADWKRDMVYPHVVPRFWNAPNLYINGKFHHELDVTFSADFCVVNGTTPYSTGIVAKYGLGNFGLSDASWKVIFDEKGAKEEVINKTKEIIYG